MTISRANLVLTTVIALSSYCTVAAARTMPLDDALKGLAAGIQQRNFSKTYSNLSSSLSRLNELYGSAKSIAKPAKTIVGEITRGLDAFNGSPKELGSLVEMIDADTKRLNDVTVSVPTFGDPSQGISASDLSSGDPVIRGAALDRVLAQGDKLRAEFTTKLNRYEGLQKGAYETVGEAISAEDRGIALEKTLDQLDDSAAGYLMNIYGQHLAFMAVDMTMSVNPSLAGRTSAAKSVAKRYDDTIDKMRDKLRQYRSYENWARFYRWQDWVRQYSPLNARLKEAQDILAKVNKLGDLTSTGASPGALAIAQLLQKTVRETGATQEQAQRLIETAARKDAEAAAQQEHQALLGLGAALSGAGGAVAGAGAGNNVAGGATVPAQTPPILVPRVMRFGSPGGTTQPDPASQPNSVPVPPPN